MNARIVTFIGAKGGTGTTTACVEIAREAEGRKQRGAV